MAKVLNMPADSEVFKCILAQLPSDTAWDLSNQVQRIYANVKDDEGQPLRRYCLVDVNQFKSTTIEDKKAETHSQDFCLPTQFFSIFLFKHFCCISIGGHFEQADW